MINDKHDIIEKLEQCIINAESKKSKLNDYVTNMQGMSSYKIRHLLNNIGNISDFNYLEVGSWKGSTLCSVLHENTINNCYCVENFSELTDLWWNGKTVRDELVCNINIYDKNNIKLIEDNYFDLDLTYIKEKINLFLYDGNHDEESQYNALYKVYDILDEYFIYMVDDISFEHVTRSLNKSLEKLVENNKIEILYSKIMQGGGNNINEWWNGFSIFYIKKLN